MTRPDPPCIPLPAAPRLDRRTFLKSAAGLTVGALVAGRGPRAHAQAGGPLIVDVYGIPVPAFAGDNHHPGVEVLLRALACSGVHFYQAPASFPLSDPTTGLIARDDVVLIKVNGQWQYRGITSSDVLRGVIQRVLDHPEGFVGEVVVVENGQGRGSLDGRGSPGSYPATTVGHANAEDESHTFRWLVEQRFNDPRVSAYLLDPIRNTGPLAAGEHVQDGYRMEPTAGFVSYPCFTTTRGTRVELADGIWDGSGYRPNLKLINLPVFKTHGGSAVTGALKHMYGLLSMRWNSGAYHYAQLGNAVADMHTLVRTPTLNIIDAIWVSPGQLAGYPASATRRTDQLVAGFDPVALDYHAGKTILWPAGGDPYHDPDTSTDYRNALIQARDRINANGGIRGTPVTFDETTFQVVRADAAVATPASTLQATKLGADVHLAWQGGSAPFRVWRSEARDLAAPVLLSDCCMTRSYVDAGVLADGRDYYYRVE